MALTVRERNNEQMNMEGMGQPANPSLAPTLGGGQGGSITGIAQRQQTGQSGRGSGFTPLQQYIKANEDNPNAQIIRQRTEEARQAQAGAQTGFQNVLGQTQAGVQRVGQQGQAVQSALQRAQTAPSQLSSADIQRVRALATGQEAIANPTNLLQNLQGARSGLLSTQQNIGQGLGVDIGTGLQDYLRSRRVNPEQATAGENRLDRFLAQSTISGQEALRAGEEARQNILGTQAPDITGLETQIAGLPANVLTKEAIQNTLTQAFNPEQQFLSGMNKQFVDEQVAAQLKAEASNRDYTNQINALLSLGGQESGFLPNKSMMGMNNNTLSDVKGSPNPFARAELMRRAITESAKQIPTLQADLQKNQAENARLQAELAAYDAEYDADYYANYSPDNPDQPNESRRAELVRGVTRTQNNINAQQAKINSINELTNELNQSADMRGLNFRNQLQAMNRQQVLENLGMNERIARARALSQLAGTESTLNSLLGGGIQL